MNVQYLAECPEVIPVLSRWHNGQWGYHDPTDSVEKRIERLGLHLNRKAIPVTFVAMENGGPLGSASLIKEDLESRPDLTPWLASVYVDAVERGRGVGSLLVRRVMEEAREIGVKTLYLYTPDRESFYMRLGWKPIQRTSHDTQRGPESIVVMSYDVHPV